MREIEWRQDRTGWAGGEVESRPAPGKVSMTQRLQARARREVPAVEGGSETEQPVQRRASGVSAFDDPFGMQLLPQGNVQAKSDVLNGPDADPAQVHAAAQRGLAGSAQALPHLEAIQRAFGPHDVRGIQAHVGGAAAEASQAIGASAYATGDAVAFGEMPDLHTAAHEAAHVVQQRGGVQLKGGVGEVGDPYERNADAVADRVVRGESAVDLLPAGQAPTGSSVQRQEAAAPGAAGPQAGGAGNAAAQLEEAIQILETALAVATGEIGDASGGGASAASAAPDADAGDGGAAAPPSAAAPEAPRVPPEVAGQLQAGLVGLIGLRGAPEDQILAAVTPILLQVGSPVAGAGANAAGAAGGPTAAPVQRNTLVLGAPLLAAGPPGWVAYAVLGVATVGIMGYVGYQTYRARTRERERAEPRVEPRTRDRPQEHRGRIQVQGGEGGGLELSYPWVRPTPMTKVEALAGLAGLQAMLTRGQLSLRNQAFVSAAAFITATLHTCPPDISRSFQNRDVRQRDGDERVDVEIRTGIAFV